MNYFVKNIYKLPNPEGGLTHRKDMPQLDKDDIENIIKNN